MRFAPVVALVLSLVVSRMAFAQDASLPPLPPPPAPEPAVAPASASVPAPAPASASVPAPVSAHTPVSGAYLHDGLYVRFSAGPSYTSLWEALPRAPARHLFHTGVPRCSSRSALRSAGGS
ncbi:MAG TPA: hypothetical protein VII82_03620 [Polyangiaceae bacterium]|jgi:hypothetical protein